MINLACTNVPGPLIPLYGTGHRMLDFYPLIPLAGDLGLGIAILSYDQYLHWGICCDPDIVPDVDRIGELVGEEFRALREAAGVQASDLPEVIGIHVAAKQVPGSQTEGPRAPVKPPPQRRSAAQKAAVPMQAASPTATVVKNKPAAPKSSEKATPKVSSSATKATATSSNGKQSVRQMQKTAPAPKRAVTAVKGRATSSNGKRAAKKAPARPASAAQTKTKRRTAAQVKAATSSR
jgi:hypothetical protein